MVFASALTPDVQADVAFFWAVDSLFPSVSQQLTCWDKGLPSPPQLVDLGLMTQPNSIILFFLTTLYIGFKILSMT